AWTLGRPLRYQLTPLRVCDALFESPRLRTAVRCATKPERIRSAGGSEVGRRHGRPEGRRAAPSRCAPAPRCVAIRHTRGTLAVAADATRLVSPRIISTRP